MCCRSPAGGIAISATVNNNASVTVSAAGSAEYSTVSNGGIVTVLSGGHADFSVISAGGEVLVSSGGYAIFPRSATRVSRTSIPARRPAVP